MSSVCAEIDDEVLAAARAGDAWAFTRIWRSLAPAVAAFARARGCEEPDDLTSEVFLAVLTRVASFEGGPAAFRAWVFVIARHKVIDHLRRRTRWGIPMQYDAGRDGRSVPSAEDDAVTAVGTAAVLEAFSSLSTDQREVLFLRIVVDLTIEQIAELLGKRTGAIKALQRRGLASLQRQVDQAVPLAAVRAITGLT